MTPRTLNFGTIERDAEVQRKTAKLMRGDGGPLKLELMPIANDNVTASLREIEPGEQYELDVEMRPPWPRGTVRTKVDLKTGVPEAPDYLINVYARMAPRLRANPARFMIPADLDSERDFMVQLVWSGGDPGKILDVTCSDPEMTARYEEQNDGQFVVLHVPAGHTLKRKTRPYVTVKTSDPEAKTSRIQVYPISARSAARRQAGTLRPRPVIQGRPRTITTTAPAHSARPAGKPGG
jgi:hypothetical protein